ncbi:MAG: InlB B-repeat-containing protein, partial [Bacilli bacterium]
MFGCKGKATDNEISMRVSDNYIQWRIGESGDWNNLISLEELQGSDGLGIDSISINAESELVIKFTDGTERNLGNIKGSAGTDGVGLQSVSINENGELIITLSNNQQVNAGKVVGTDGKAGREVELSVDEARNYIQWRYKDEETWYDLISLEALTGEQGNAGLNGLSAYEIYKQYYPDYEKTEEEWIDDLVNGRLATVEKVKLTFELNGGQGISEMEVVKGRTVDLPLPSRCGYRFLGWYSGDGVFDGKFTHFIPVVKDLTLYAKWELIILEGIEIADGDLELPQDSVHQLTVVEKPSNALLPDLVWSSSAPEVVSVDENGLLTAHELGQAVITVKSADEAFSDSIVVTVIDDVDPEFKGIEPEPGLIIVRDGDKFKLKIRASDKNLFELEIDHSLEATLPEFSVYASEDLPYGSLEAKARFEAYGVTVDYDAESQTWEIDFGENVTSTFVSAKKVKFYIVL